ncbi:C4-dicarboxylate TRAP transporter substrate-binding protein [Salinarimonas chemoclinalis]|uniref:C4-dicarboxylate TRAP transporter substrate-binding protein n=1 Tax=Salinarimonas chemoclinalis TaxID=3241599 RepID=UPI0035564C36
MKTLTRLLIAGTMLAPATALAQETIDLTVASSHPTTIPWIGMIQTHFMTEVDRILAEQGAYEIAWNEAFGGTLYKANATLTSVEQGITDIGWVFSYLEGAKMPLSQVTGYTPFSTNDVPVQLETMMELYETVPEFRNEWEQYNLVFLGATGADSYDLYTKRPIESLDDLQGLKLSAPGVLGTWLRGTGANAVDGALTTFYTDLQTGVSDGALSLAMGVLPAKLYEVAPYITRVDIGVVFSGGLAINRDTWDGLPEPVQQALLQAGDVYSKAHAQDLMERHESALERMVELGATQDPPVTLTPMDPAERQRWVEALPDLAGEWAQAAEERGLPGREFLTAYMEGLRARGETPARDWDRAE